MTEAERLRLAAEYRRAYTETDLIARIGFNSLADARRDGVPAGGAIDVQLDRFVDAVGVEEAALARLQAARAEA